MTLKRLIIFAISLTFLFAQTPQQIVDELAKLPELAHAQWSVYARYIDEVNGEGPVVEHNGDMSLSCASSLKVITLGLALDKLGPDFTFKTRLYYSGIIDENGILDGNIYIVGDGDPTLGGDQVGGVYSLKKLMSLWVKAIKKTGIKAINGMIVADESLYDPYHVPSTWTWEDVGNYYGAGLTALCISDNKYYLDFKPGPKEGDSAEVIAFRPEIPGMSYTNMMKTGPMHSGDNGYIISAPNIYHAIFHGTVPAGEEKFTIKGAIPNPALLTAQMLEQALKKEGVSLQDHAMVINDKQNYRNEKLLKTIKSPPLKRIAEITNKLSNNTYTEMLLLKVAKEETGIGETEAGIKVIDKFMDKLNIEHSGMRLVDASGLSHENMITTKVFCDYLSAMTTRTSFPDFYNTFATAGDENDFGYVVYFGKDTPIAMNAKVKTGYIGGVRSHTGYVSTRSGRLIAFSCIANNYHCKTKEITKIHEKVIVALATME
ncbi:MAG: D-alanyl-D-alanine carboxypeptidase/D-alanyl-D-alanine-endopeptidase [Candidatus Marinimicrobia bacterium]|nr:D-alanyl-D-alanine carboxypeptidase/D-alanyl-D-alanine-endopeptidase [Candidatus Neomarinimicrobiota bacterium]